MAGLPPPPPATQCPPPPERSAMSNVFTLDALKAEARKKYEPVVIALSDESTVELKSVLLLGKKNREAVVAAIGEINDLPDLDEDEEEDDELVDELASEVCTIVAKVIRLICTSPRKLLAELDTVEEPRIRAEVYTDVLKHWMSETQLGEAEASPS